uniref:Uncharacterized protein n=1 Tax=Syphacia muris TaxID=451379 RepID=A0A0N5AR80_9BILA
MSSNRPLMNVNEDSEILFKLGILTSKAKSKRHFEGEQRNADNGTLSGTITDDEDSELDVLYDKQNLLKREPEQADKKQRHFSVQKVVPSISFFILGLLNVLVLVTIPEVATNVAKAESSATTSVSLLSLVVINAKRLLKRCNPLFLLILSTVCSIPFTLVIVWCVKLYSVYFYVFVLSILLGFIHEGGFIIIAIDGMSVRTLLLLHVFISGGSLVASAVCLLFVRDSNQLLVPLQQSSTVPVTPHYISDNVKRSLLQKPAAYSVFFNGSEESNGKKSELSTLWDTAPLASNVENGFTLIRPNSSSKNFKSDDAKFLFSSAVRKRFSKNESAIKNTNHLWYLWKGQVSNLTELKIAYGFVAVLAFSIMVFFVLPLYFCIGNSHFVKENERKSFGRLTIAHSRHNWQWLACILFFILSGVEGIFCVTVALCASYLFNSDNLLQMAYFTIFLFWAGSIVARFTLSSSSRLASSMQLMQFLLLITSVISCFGALFSQNSSIVALNVEIFLIGKATVSLVAIAVAKGAIVVTVEAV